MEDIINGESASATESLGTVGSSKSSTKKGSHSTKKTRQSAQKEVTVTKPEALQFLSSALDYILKAGFMCQVQNLEDIVLIAVTGANITDYCDEVPEFTVTKDNPVKELIAEQG